MQGADGTCSGQLMRSGCLALQLYEVPLGQIAAAWAKSPPNDPSPAMTVGDQQEPVYLPVGNILANLSGLFGF